MVSEARGSDARVGATLHYLKGLLAAAMVLGAVSGASAESRLLCQPYQLEAYRQDYTSVAQCWARERGLRGASEFCCLEAFGGPLACAQVRENIDWVFRDGGALATYSQQRQSGKSPFESVVGAQGHNPPVQSLLLGCRDTAEAYLAARGTPPVAPPPNARRPGESDCPCITVVRTGVDFQGRNSYSVKNSCAAIEVWVQIIDARSPGAGGNWAQLGVIGPGQARTVTAAATFAIPSVSAYNLRNAAGNYTCICRPALCS